MELRCGVARADITPVEHVPGIPLAGFGFYRRATAVLDPLEAIALHLTDGTRAVTFVAMDLIGFLYPYVDRLRARLRGAGGAVLPCSTHDHAAPDTIGLWGRSLFGKFPIRSGVVPEYMQKLQSSLESVVRSAARDVQGVSVRAAQFEVPPDWFRNDRKGGGKDDFGEVLAFEAPDGRRLATLVCFAAHPETLWEHNTFVSADYPGALRRRLRELTRAEGLFFSGALGGMVTANVPLSMDVSGRKAAVERLGAGLAERAVQALEAAPVVPVDRLEIRTMPLELPLQNWRFRVARRLGILEREFVLDRVRTEMNLVRIGEEVSVLTAPGECTPEVGRELVECLPGRHRFLFCLGCDEIGYILTPEQFANPEYRYEQSMSLGPATAPALIRAARDLVGIA